MQTISTHFPVVLFFLIILIVALRLFLYQKFPQSSLGHLTATFAMVSYFLFMESLSGIKHPAFREAQELTRLSGRQQSGRYLLEDESLVLQGLESATCTIHAVFTTPNTAPRLQPLCASANIPLYALGPGLMSKLTGTGYETNINAIAIAGQNTISPSTMLSQSPSGLFLCGEKIQDPRNVGVLIRTADALGASGLILSEDSAEPYSRASVRSTTGSITRLPLSLTANLPSVLLSLKSQGVTIISSSGNVSRETKEVDFTVRPLVIIMGNEQNGISPDVATVSNVVVRLPMGKDTKADSYNVTVAAGMLLYEAIRNN
jgi:RNA methyltransferase, TrmH family